MPALLIHHKVADYDIWRRLFDEDAGTLRAYGSQGWRVFRTDAEAGEVWILLEWDDPWRARFFARSDVLLDALARAGVADRPDCWYLEETNPAAS